MLDLPGVGGCYIVVIDFTHILLSPQCCELGRDRQKLFAVLDLYTEERTYSSSIGNRWVHLRIYSQERDVVYKDIFGNGRLLGSAREEV